MKRVLGIALAAALFASAAPAPVLAQVPLTPSAQLPAGAVDPNETLVEELVVTARLPGPAWWRVSDADSTVYVMGVPSVIPKGSGWDPSVLERRLEGANLVILPSNVGFTPAEPTDSEEVTFHAIVLNNGAVDAHRVLVQFIDMTTGVAT